MNLVIFLLQKFDLQINICKWSLLSFFWLIASISYSQEVKNDSISEEEKLYLTAIKEIDSARYKQAIPILKKVIKLNPMHVNAWNKMAYAKIKLKDYKGAEKDLQKSD